MSIARIARAGSRATDETDHGKVYNVLAVTTGKNS